MDREYKIFIGASAGYSFYSKFIRFYQYGFPYVHIFYITPENENIYKRIEMQNLNVIEAWNGKVRHGNFFKHHKPQTKFDIFYVDVSASEKEIINNFIYEQIDKKYDWFGIFSFITRKDIDSKQKWFCSELVFEAFKYAGIKLLNYTESYEVSPKMFLRSPLVKRITSNVKIKT